MNAARITVGSIAIASIAALLPIETADACEVSRSKWGMVISDCNLSEFLKGYDVPIKISPELCRLNLPNLRVDDIEYTYYGPFTGDAVEVRVEAENVGCADSRAFEIAAVSFVTDPLNGGQSVNSQTFAPVSVPGLAVGSSSLHYAGTISLPNRTQDWDICTMATVDPPLSGGPASGNVGESNEADNTTGPNECCRFYGPNPDTTGPRAC